jgi:hypothetical protein
MMVRAPALLRRATPPLLLAAALAASLAACAGGDAGTGGAVAEPSRAAPAAEFLLAAGDSTFWIRGDSLGARSRGAPLLLVRHADAWHELYVSDVDRSHLNAVFIGQRLYWRNLATGDSAILLADTSVLALERAYARATPWDRLARPDEEVAANPAVDAVTDIAVLDQHGPFVTVEVHVDIETADTLRRRHEVRRQVVDLRLGRTVSVAELAGPEAGDVLRAGRDAWRRARDSIRADTSEAARLAKEALDDFPWDPASFGLTIAGGAPAVAFVVPGRGLRSGGFTLPLAPVPLAAPAWWRPDDAAELPRDAGDGTITWDGPGYEIVVRPDSAGERGTVVLREADGSEWPAARVPLPVRRAWRLDAPPLSPRARGALERAFDDAARYGDNVRTAATPPHPSPDPAARAVARPIRR